ncbi:MAG: hypothetical protein M1816_004180 [Peltula sp. TS41687]|nr:MAG: hypothetical protein M1816_004180 [Peltula sp. TS41687]
MSKVSVNGKAVAHSEEAVQGGGYRHANPGGVNAPMVNVQPPRRDDLQPSYAQTLVDDDSSAHGWYGAMSKYSSAGCAEDGKNHEVDAGQIVNSLGTCVGTLGSIPGCVICPDPYKSIMQGNVGLVTKFGRFTRAVDPGLVRINPLSEKLHQVDVKIQIVEVPQQTCMTKDNVTLHLTSVIYYHITSPHKAAFGIANIRTALVERTQTTLRHVVGARVLQEVIERREEIAQSIGEIIEDVAHGWGVQVESMLIKDIIFSNELQDSLSLAAQAKRVGESKIIAARAEVESAKLMRQAADQLNSKAAMQIRYLEAMQAMAKTSNSKVIFMPGSVQTMTNQMPNTVGAAGGEGSSSSAGPAQEFGQEDDAFQRAINARVIENI